MRTRRKGSAQSVNMSVRLDPEQAQHLRRWALNDPLDRGMGHVLRRLIDEEVLRERDREHQL